MVDKGEKLDYNCSKGESLQPQKIHEQRFTKRDRRHQV